MKNHLPDGIRVRWFGHATFEIVGPTGQKFLIDPYFVNNPKFPAALGGEVTAPGAGYHCLLVTHPHQLTTLRMWCRCSAAIPALTVDCAI